MRKLLNSGFYGLVGSAFAIGFMMLSIVNSAATKEMQMDNSRSLKIHASVQRRPVSRPVANRVLFLK